VRYLWVPVIVIGFVLIPVGAVAGQFAQVLLGGLAAGLGVWRWRAHRFVQQDAHQRPAAVDNETMEHDKNLPADADDMVERLIEQSLKDDRAAVLLRPELAATLSNEHLRLAVDQFTALTSIVPQGRVAVHTAVALVQAPDMREAENGRPKQPIVDAFYLDRYAVTNQQFQRFADAGGYEEMDYWPTESWAEVMEFVDATGQPGPRFWRNGEYSAGKANHPVVGVNWYEASAYAHWAGRRLPTDSEWVKAASWPVEVETGQLAVRRYPWGDVMGQGQANVYNAGVGDTAEVDGFPENVSANGVYQLAGNVWEWTLDDAGEAVESAMIAGDMILPGAMKCIRGGAFDTYFENQASCEFRSAERPTARKHNVGFRCVLSVADIVDVTGDVAALESHDLQAVGDDDPEGAEALEECGV
jgi:iron(II)-dependent oxidoreductase